MEQIDSYFTDLSLSDNLFFGGFLLFDAFGLYIFFIRNIIHACLSVSIQKMSKWLNCKFSTIYIIEMRQFKQNP